MADDGKTLSIPHGEKFGCPALRHQTSAALARGVCGRCGGLLDGPQAARILKARELTRQIWGRDGG